MRLLHLSIADPPNSTEQVTRNTMTLAFCVFVLLGLLQIVAPVA